MDKNRELSLKIKEANRFFYDSAADFYEKIDGRRTDELVIWLRENLKSIKNMTEGDFLLDVGCGSGIVMRAAEGIFNQAYGIDISAQIIRDIQGKVICADGEFIPFKEKTFNAVVCFSVLHHLYESQRLFSEIYRVLKKGGILYIDHDMEMKFFKLFFPLIKIYRYIFNPARRYMKLNDGLTKELYALSEIHSNGVNSTALINQLMNIGFSKIEMHYHWFGLNKFLNKIMKQHHFKKGFAPLVSIWVRK